MKMLSSSMLKGLRTAQSTSIFKRNLAAPTDPIQKLFLEKIREYRKKSPNDELVEPSPEIEKELKSELAKLEKRYGGGPGIDMAAFPQFQFDDPKLDPIDEVIAATPAKKKK